MHTIAYAWLRLPPYRVWITHHASIDNDSWMDIQALYLCYEYLCASRLSAVHSGSGSNAVSEHFLITSVIYPALTMITIFLRMVMAYYIRTKTSVFYPGLTMIIFFLCNIVMACYIRTRIRHFLVFRSLSWLAIIAHRCIATVYHKDVDHGYQNKNMALVICILTMGNFSPNVCS